MLTKNLHDQDSTEDDQDDNPPMLSVESLRALQEFQNEKQLLLYNESGPGSCPPIEEDWQLSQFWYDESTADVLAREALRAAGPTGHIACVSCPTVYRRLRSIVTATDGPDLQVVIKLFEYDRRFEIYSTDFVFYDYRNPLDVAGEFESEFDIVVADPPFLSEECLEKVSQTIKYVGKQNIILCTGATMENLACELLDVKLCTFKPRHVRNLANEFSCYSNYNFDNYVDAQSHVLKQ